MARYVCEKKKKPKFKKCLVITSLGLAVGLGLYRCSRRDEGFDRKVDYVLDELSFNQKAMDRNYSKLVDVVESELDDYPEQANRLVISSLYSLENREINKRTYNVIIDRVAEKVERDPEVLDNFGENAQRYMQEKAVGSYIDHIGEKVNRAVDVIKEKSKPLIKDLENKKESLMEKLR